MVACDLGYTPREGTADILKEIREVASMLHGLRVKVEQHVASALKPAA